MVLDTGASGLVIEPSVAKQFGLPTFGDLKIAGVSGKVGWVQQQQQQALNPVPQQAGYGLLWFYCCSGERHQPAIWIGMIPLA